MAHFQQALLHCGTHYNLAFNAYTQSSGMCSLYFWPVLRARHARQYFTVSRVIERWIRRLSFELVRCRTAVYIRFFITLIRSG